MRVKEIRSIGIALGVLLQLLLPLIALAVFSVAGHRAERKVILIGGYDAQNNAGGLNGDALHTRNISGTVEEAPGWQSIIDYLTQDKGTTENALVRQIGLTNADVFLFSYSDQYDANCETGVRFGCPTYKAKDTCLTENNLPNLVAYCQVEGPAIAAVANHLTQIVDAYPNTEFDIIAHSEGGLVAAYWAATASQGLLDRVNSIISLDSPLQGPVILPFGAQVQFMQKPVKDKVALAPTKIPVYTIRNILDWAAPWSYATLNGVWNDSGLDIWTTEGQAAHEPRNDSRVLQRIALTLVAGKIIDPNAANPAQIRMPMMTGKPFTVQVAKPTFFNRTLTANDVTTSIGGQNAPLQLSSGWKPGYAVFTGGRALLNVTPVTKPTGTYALTVNTQNTQMPFSDTEANAVRYSSSPGFDIILLIDRSDSIFDELPSVQAAAKTFVDFLPLGGKIGVVSFGSDTTVNLPLTTIASDSTKQDAKNAIDSISLGGYSTIGNGLQAALDQMTLRGDPNHPHWVILVSDGYENWDSNALAVLPDVVRAHLIVHTIGFPGGGEAMSPSRRTPASGNAFSAPGLLSEIADRTGGTFQYAPDLQDLPTAFNNLTARMAVLDGLFVPLSLPLVGAPARRSPVTDNVTDVPVTVDSAVSEVTFNLNWSNSTASFDFALVKPDATTVISTTVDPNIQYSTGLTYASYHVTSPSVGTWTMQVTPVPLGSTEPFSVRADAVSGLGMEFGTNAGTYLSRAQPIIMWATLIDSTPIVGATVNVTVTPPSGGYITIPLFDDGQHLDGVANDGTYANQLDDTAQDGTYVLTFSATGNSNSNSPFMRMGQSAVVVEPNPSPTCDLFVTSSGPSQIKPGTPITYTITYGNQGPDSCDNIIVSDLFPVGTTYLSDSRGDGNDLYGAGRQWIIGSLAPTSQDSFTLSVSVPPTITIGNDLTNHTSIFVQFAGTSVLPMEPNFDNNMNEIMTNVTSFLYLPFIKKN